jgi:hypothetical protein
MVSVNLHCPLKSMGDDYTNDLGAFILGVIGTRRRIQRILRICWRRSITIIHRDVERSLCPNGDAKSMCAKEKWGTTANFAD